MTWFNRALAWLTARRAAENPGVPLSFPSDDLWEALGGGQQSRAGLRITPQAALSYAAVFRAVNLIAKDVAKVPLLTYRRGDGEAKFRDTRHPAWRLLHQAPNEWQTPFEFRTLLTAHALLLGNGYAYIERNGRGQPMELLPLDPASVVPGRWEGEVWYQVTVTGEPIKVPAADVLHIRGLSLDGLAGLSVVSLARESIGLGLGALAHGAVFFRNAATPKVVLESPGKLKPGAAPKLREDWEKMHTGIDGAHRTAVLENGLKAHVLSLSARDSQFLETREHQLREIAAWFGVPPHRLGDTTRTSFASLEAEANDYLQGAIDPWLVAWEQQCSRKLLSPRERERSTHLIEALRLALVQIDAPSRVALYGSGLQNGWLSIDEVRARENLNPLPDGQGQVWFRPLNVQAVGPGAESQPEPEEPADDQVDVERIRRAAVAVVGEAGGRVAKRLAKWAAKRPDADLEGAERYHGSVIREALAPALDVAEAAGGQAKSVDDVARSVLQEVVEANGDLEAWAEALPASLLERLGLEGEG